MAISITLPRRSGQTNPLTSAQWDEVVGIIETAFSQVSTSTGSVTSVNATVPNGLTVSGVPIVGAGTIAIGNNLSSGFVKSAGVGSGFTSSASIGLTSDVSGTLPLANGGTNKSSWTSSRIVIVNGSGALSEADTATYPSLTELSYVKGVTSAIQTQINSKEPTISILPTTKGGTGVNLSSRQDLINYLVNISSATTNNILYFDGANLAWTAPSVGSAGVGIGISSGIISLKNGSSLTGGSVLYWDGVNSQITQDNNKLFFNGTALGVGTNTGLTKTLNVAGDARFTSNLNSAAQIDIVNGSSGNAALSELRVLNNSSTGFAFSVYSSGYTTIGTLDIASTALLSSDTLPMNLVSNNTTGIRIWSSNGSGTFTEAVRFANTETVFNDVGATRNFRIEGDTNANVFFVDASNDRVGIGTNTPTTTLQVAGTLNATGATTLASTLNVTGITTLSNNLVVDTNVLFVDSVNDCIGIRTNTGLTKTLNVAGDARFTSNLNSAAQIDIVNGSSGNSALSELRVLNNSSAGFSFSAYSSGYTTIGTLDIASTAFMSSGTLPMNLASDNTTGIRIWSSNGSGTFTEAVRFANTETVFNDVGANRDFRIEGDTISNLFFVDASEDNIGIGTNTPNPAVKLHIFGTNEAGTDPPWVLIENDGTGTTGPSLMLRYGTTPAVKSGAISRNTNSLNINDTDAIVITAPINLFNNDNRVAGTLCVASSSTTINASAILQADSTTRGFLPPRMTTAQRDAIASPAAGLMIFNTTTSRANVYTGTAWDALH